jgi:hypothetical protein
VGFVLQDGKGGGGESGGPRLEGARGQGGKVGRYKGSLGNVYLGAVRQ